MKASDARRRWARWRDGLRDRPNAEFGYRVVVGLIGLMVLAVGILAIPYPGPGWGIVFVGLAILATEFNWARRLLTYTRQRYDKVMAWFKAQGPWVQVLGTAFTAAIVLGTMWLLGVLGWAVGLVGVDAKSLKSPIGLGA